jgi:hypothetical protein
MKTRCGNFDGVIVKELLSAHMPSWKNINLEVLGFIGCCHVNTLKLIVRIAEYVEYGSGGTGRQRERKRE